MFIHKIYDKWMAETQREKLEKILAEIGTEKLEGKRILDVGSGPGFLGRLLQEKCKSCSVVSSDIDIDNLEKASGLKVLASGDFLPFKKIFDFVFCVDTVHLLDKKKVEKEFASVLNDSGILVVSAFCSKYNAEERMKELKNVFSGLKIEERFFAKAKKEWDAVVIARLK